MADLLQEAPDQSGSRTGVYDREWLTGDLEKVEDDYPWYSDKIVHHMTTLLSEVDVESQIYQIDTVFQMMASMGFYLICLETLDLGLLCVVFVV